MILIGNPSFGSICMTKDVGLLSIWHRYRVTTHSLSFDSTFTWPSTIRNLYNVYHRGFYCLFNPKGASIKDVSPSYPKTILLRPRLIKAWKGPFIKNVINRGGRGLPWSYLISLFSKNYDEGGRGCQKSQKIDDFFYEWLQMKISTFT